MLIDALLLFSDAQALTATAVSTNVIDLGADSNVGIGEPMAVVVSLDVAADDSDGDETYSVDLQADSTAAFSSAAVIATRAITRGDVAGTKYVLSIPADTSGEQFLRLNFTLGGTTPTATVTAYVIPQSMVQNYVSYADGFTIS